MNPMLTNPEGYFSQWIPERSQLMRTLEQEAQTEQIPIIGPLVGQLLYILARMHNAKHIVELGTAIGYSTLFLAKACIHNNGKVCSYDISPELVQRAKINIRSAGLDRVTQIYCEDGLAALKQRTDPVDMIFIDIDKEDYVRALPDCTRILRSGGLLFADNTGFKDALSFNQAIHESKQWESINLWCFLPLHSPEHDGLCLALKK